MLETGFNDNDSAAPQELGCHIPKNLTCHIPQKFNHAMLCRTAAFRFVPLVGSAGSELAAGVGVCSAPKTCIEFSSK